VKPTKTIETLKELECDPLKLSAHIALGKNITEEHPDFKKIKSNWVQLLTQLKQGEIDPKNLSKFWNSVESALQQSPLSLDLRSKHILNLTKLVAPSLSAIQQENFDYDMGNLDSISDEDLERIARGELDEL